LDPLLVRLAHRIVANSEATARRFAPAFRNKTTVLYNAVDLRWLSDESVKKPEQIDDRWKIILVVSHVSRVKRHDVILSAFELVAKTQPHLHLVCLGPVDHTDPGWWKYLNERTSRSEFAGRIHWIGEVLDPRGWYRSAFALVLASEKESFGRVLVEAMACGVPVIATNVGGIPEVLRGGQDGLLVPPGNPQDLADAISRLLDDTSLRLSLSTASRARAGAFDLPRLVNGMSQLFEEVITDKS
jgi:glycosyltransferase involved in cell wall biosynthesis